MSLERYNTYVISTDNFNATKVVGELVGLGEAQNLEGLYSTKYKGIDYFVQSYPVGSERDVECQKDLKKIVKVK